MKRKFILPETLVLLFIIICVMAALTWIIPGGQYSRDDSAGRTMVVPGSFQYGESQPQNIHTVFLAPIRGFIDAAQIIVFVVFMGGVFGIIQATGAFRSLIHFIVQRHEHSRFLQRFSIPVLMIVFSIAGSTFGMSEETIPFVLIFVPLALSLGYDSIVGTAIPYVGAHAGFAAAFLNPFTLGVAQGISELPPSSGFEYRFFCWVIVTTVAIIFVMRYAAKIKAKPELSPTYHSDLERRKSVVVKMEEAEKFTSRHKLVLFSFAFSIGVLVYGVLKLGWYINEIAALFLACGILCGIIGKVSPNKCAKEFVSGAQDLILTAFVIAFARGILLIAQDGRVIDTILYYLSSGISKVPGVLSVQLMLVVQSFLNFFVPSGSGQAALTIPILAPLSDLIGITRQTTVLAFQFGDGFSNMIIPTSGVLMGALGFAKMDWRVWAKWMVKLQIILLITGMTLLTFPVIFNWGPF
ncbi:MAG: putative basic amino acid antiporter YfcC [bacterium]|nr:putative basic amino acid antiporter YfcC [bacterium]